MILDQNSDLATENVQNPELLEQSEAINEVCFACVFHMKNQLVVIILENLFIYQNWNCHLPRKSS